MSKNIKTLIIIFSIIIISSVCILLKSNSVKSTETSKNINSFSSQQSNEIDSILKTRKYTLLEGKEYIEYDLPYSTDEIMKNEKLMLQLRDKLENENTFFTMLKLNDGNGVLVQTKFQSLTIGSLGDDFFSLNNILYDGDVYKDNVVYFKFKETLPYTPK